MTKLTLIPASEAASIRKMNVPEAQRLALLSDICRLNALTAIKRAGSGHIGTSFSSLDIMTALYFHEMNVFDLGYDNPNRDVFLSSKGHDAPGVYAILYAGEVLDEQRFLDLRRITGVPGHPDIHATTGVEANTGSLGMGISKARGIALAKRIGRRGGRVFVLAGDGELQEGQNFEALQNAIAQDTKNLWVFIDHNKVQSDRLVAETLDLGDLEKKFSAFGWHVARCDGNDMASLLNVFTEFQSIDDRPKICVCDTIKGKGVSFMQHTQSLPIHDGLYRWHSGAPNDADYASAMDELLERIDQRAEDIGLQPPNRRSVEAVQAKPWASATETITSAYGRRLTELGGKRPDLIVLDADLALDCGLLSFMKSFPDRFVENGIAEQDMVSVAGGLALQGYLPVVNSFACFLGSRAQEQIFTNNTERTKIIYVNHYAGLLPAAAGFSHQSLRDIALFGSLPECVIVQPVSAREATLLIDYLVDVCDTTAMIRVQLGPFPKTINLPENYTLRPGQGTVLTPGSDAVLLCYGPVMTTQAVAAARALEKDGFGLCVVTTPWLNRLDLDWMDTVIAGIDSIFVLEDHGPVGGFADFLFGALVQSDRCAGRRLRRFAVEGIPACGTPFEVLQHHRLDVDSLATRIKIGVQRR